jgi:hypothetical protein
MVSPGLHDGNIMRGPSSQGALGARQSKGSGQRPGHTRKKNTEQQLKQFPYLDHHHFEPTVQCATVPPYQQLWWFVSAVPTNIYPLRRSPRPGQIITIASPVVPRVGAPQ